MTIGLNPTGTVKASRTPGSRQRNATTGISAAERNLARQQSAVARSKEKASATRKAREVAGMAEAPCPMREVLEAAAGGDEYALSRAVNLYGKHWRALISDTKRRDKGATADVSERIEGGFE